MDSRQPSAKHDRSPPIALGFFALALAHVYVERRQQSQRLRQRELGPLELIAARIDVVVAGATEVGSPEVAPNKVAAPQVAVAEVGAGQHGLVKGRLVEPAAAQRAAAEIEARKVAEVEQAVHEIDLGWQTGIGAKLTPGDTDELAPFEASVVKAAVGEVGQAEVAVFEGTAYEAAGGKLGFAEVIPF